MNKYYYELRLNWTDADTKDIMVSFISDLTNDAIEFKDDDIIIRSSDELENIKYALEEYIDGLKEIFKKLFLYKIELSKNKNEDWIAKYKSSINPIEVGKFYIRPSWEDKKENLIDVIVDPALAFGSGHHESTSSILKVLHKYVKSGDSVLDVGCGSGILSIASAKLGANIDICDTDEQAITSSHDNFDTNNVKVDNSWVGSSNLAKNQYDVVLANIIADVLLMIKNDLIKCMKPNAKLIISGILNKYQDRITSKFSELRLVEKIQNDEWTTFVYERLN
ncbi:MAG: Ribosomal protein L11 methyltransferase (EC [uncultured Campylobacterales bacterium]|uniref:Ribosomal protein L11 methyltransferase n=1 Tax=uncultured Campylobacterales bacterium TaxID=352960 RepID=A0A6S6T5A3_9BACT|nr:MAG: Ribosomal protein L11 methyltransferase (EC [uncultured Campylobacterales bacterium]